MKTIKLHKDRYAYLNWVNGAGKWNTSTGTGTLNSESEQVK